VLQAIIRQQLTGAELSILLCIIDKTWGFGKLFDAISREQICKAVRYCDRTVKYSIGTLKARRILLVEPSSKRGQCGSPFNNYMVNKHHDTWIEKGGKIVPPLKRGQDSSPFKTATYKCSKTTPKRGQRSAPTIERKNKKKIKKYTPPILCICEYVQMTDEELNTLLLRFGEQSTLKMIEKLDNYKGASGKKYKSDYRAILSWVVDQVMEKETSLDAEKRKFRELVRDVV